jgi:hypothetical protein
MTKKAILPSEADISQFKMLSELVDAVYIEMKELSKKKPDDLLNKFKVKSVNRVIEKLKVLLMSEPTVEFLDVLDEESLPSNSDSVLIISQHIAALKQFKSKYYFYDSSSYENRWKTKENP